MPSGPHRQQEDAIMRSVVHLLRGLSALFWGLPLVLLAEAHTELYAKGRWTVPVSYTHLTLPTKA